MEHDARSESRADVALRESASAPDDLSRRERAARALMAEERHLEAIELLRAALIHLNAHAPGSLPCLCRRCLVASEAESLAMGKRFVRDFVVAADKPKGRVLFYWMPEDLAGQTRRVRRSVQVGLRSRLGG